MTLKDFLKNNKWNLSVIFTSFLLLLFSILHKLQSKTDTQAYMGSIYVPLEIIFLVIIFLMSTINATLIIVYLIKKDWNKLFITLGVIITTILLYMIAIAIDVETLLYMT